MIVFFFNVQVEIVSSSASGLTHSEALLTLQAMAALISGQKTQAGQPRQVVQVNWKSQKRRKCLMTTFE